MNLTKSTSFDPKTLAKTGFQTADKILASWGSSAQQSQNILQLSKSSYHKFKANPDTTKLNDDQFERISCLLNIHQSLRTVFSNPANVSGFMRLENNNDYFAGRSPLEVISSGRFGDLYEVAKRIDAVNFKG
jgi:hypothetical protein